MIQAKELSLIYDNGTVGIEDVDLHIEKGRTVYITGPSGSGKTSLLKLFMGMEYPTSGSLKVLGLDMKKAEEKNIRKLRTMIGPIFQEFKLISGRTSMENVMIGMRFLGMSNKKIREEAERSLTSVGLDHKMLSLVENLSWGETQRVGIARAIARKPALIIADEPTGNLDVKNAKNILNLLTQVKDKDTAVVITTHATHLIEDIKEGIFIHVRDGRIEVENRGGGI